MQVSSFSVLSILAGNSLIYNHTELEFPQFYVTSAQLRLKYMIFEGILDSFAGPITERGAYTVLFLLSKNLL